MTLKLLSYNIQKGGVGREPYLAAVINAEAPDIVVLQEATRPEVVRRLADATGMTTAIAAPGRSVACLSRVEVATYQWVRPLFSQHAFLEVVLKKGDARIVGVHLSAVHAAWTERRRVRELRSLLSSTTRDMERFHLVAGDFNTLAPDEKLDVGKLPYRLRVLVWLSGGRIRWQTIAIMLGAGYVDAFRACDPTGDGLTFPTWDPHIRLDYAFVPKACVDRVESCAVVRDNPDVRRASDHFPLRLNVHY